MTAMRRAEKEVADPAWCRSVLGEAPHLVLALNDDGTPYAVPLCVAVAEDGRIYLHMAAAGRKLDLVRSDPRAAFTAVAHAAVVPGETACATGMRAASVAGTARCRIVGDPAERRLALDAFARKYAGAFPDGYPDAVLAATVVVRLDPISMTGRRTG
jgi:nitroimidazol reductase NimA-like FMN-containing flavoprotein (pyridoxamine 5'-phosphate oxidase superfamily)